MNNRLFNLKNINESELKEFLSYINRRLKKKINLEKLTKLMKKLLQKKRSRNLGKIQIIPVTNFGNQLQEIIIEIEDKWELSKYSIAGMVKKEIKKKNYDFVEEFPIFRNTFHRNCNTKYIGNEEKLELNQLYYVDVIELENASEDSEDLIELVNELNIRSLEKEKNPMISKSLMEDTLKKSFENKSDSDYSSLKEMIIDSVSSKFASKELISYEEAEKFLNQSKEEVIIRIKTNSSEDNQNKSRI
jgi:hypothetical protein